MSISSKLTIVMGEIDIYYIYDTISIYRHHSLNSPHPSEDYIEGKETRVRDLA